MKKIQTEKERFLIENGYAEVGTSIHFSEYNELPDEEKSKYIRIDDYNYKKIANIPNVTDSELQTMALLENNKRLRKIEGNSEVTKWCALILAIATIVSAILAISSYIKLTSIFDSDKITSSYSEYDDNYDF